jgi:predicted esterase
MGRGYYTRMRITDFGPYITKIILPMQGMVSGEYPADLFSVYVERLDDGGKLLQTPKVFLQRDVTEPSRGYVKVRKCYASDREGNSLQTGEFLTLELDYGPLCRLSSMINASDDYCMHEYFIHNEYTVTQIRPLEAEGQDPLAGLCFDRELGCSCPDTEGFLESVSHDPEHPLRYGYYVPQTEQPKHPLIVWLHGAGEGGWDTKVAYAGNKVTNLITQKFQALFGGAYVFVPQCETMWLDDGNGEYGRSGRSMYGKALKSAIDEFLQKNPQIDADRVYIGGDSNGGFMTMRMIIDYPDFFAAAFPICEAFYDENISDEQIERLSRLPIWFTHAKNDPVVDPQETVVPTYRRLMDAGAENVHFTFWDGIEDMHGEFTDENGKPVEYLGHFAWIPMLNDDCRTDFDGKAVVLDGKEVTLLQWLSMQHRS